MANRRIEEGVREELFDLVCSGMPMAAAARVLGVARWTAALWWGSSGSMLELNMGRGGGLAGTAPMRLVGDPDLAERKRQPLTSEDRAIIAVGLRMELSYAQIGALIERCKSVVWREVARNRGPDGSYWAPIAHRIAHERRRRPKEFRLVAEPGLCRRIEGWMDEGWSPKLIARVLREESRT